MVRALHRIAVCSIHEILAHILNTCECMHMCFIIYVCITYFSIVIFTWWHLCIAFLLSVAALRLCKTTLEYMFSLIPLYYPTFIQHIDIKSSPLCHRPIAMLQYNNHSGRAGKHFPAVACSCQLLRRHRSTSCQGALHSSLPWIIAACQTEKTTRCHGLWHSLSSVGIQASCGSLPNSAGVCDAC